MKNDAGDYKKDIVTDEQFAASHPDYVDTDGNGQLHLSEDILEAAVKIMKAEIGDKTFCLIIIFTISWANWNIPAPGDTIELDNQKYSTKVQNSVNPIRIYLAGTMATCMVTAMTCLYQQNHYENSSRLMVSSTLVAMLLNYMFQLCSL